jgi:pilus assembly protein CpaB
MTKRNSEPAGPTGETQSIIVATSDIAMGDLLTPQVLKLEQWPKDKISLGAATRIEDVENRRARTKLYAGEPILENKLLGKGASEQGATALIPKGYRVVPVKVDLVSGGSSMILPGDRVDVMVHLVRDPGREINETVTRTILQDVKVFAVNDIVDLEKEKEGIGRSITAKTISLLVTPDQAATVMLASQLGIINLVMRSSEDDQQLTNSQAKPSELFGSPKSNRDKESLMAGTESSLGEKAKGFVDFLKSIRSKPADQAQAAAGPTSAAEEPKRETWTMRVLKPGDVQEVQFEAQTGKDAANSPLGAWKPTASSSSSGAAGNPGGAAKDVPKPAEPAPPDASNPAPPKLPPPDKPPKQQTKDPNNKNTGNT